MFPQYVTIASTQKAWHGGEQQALLLAEGMRSRGIRCTVLARESGKFASRMCKKGFDVRVFSGRGVSPSALFGIRRALGDWQPDVLFMNDGHALRACGLGLVGRRKPIRIAARRVDFSIRWPMKFTRFSDGVICVSQAVEKVCRESGLPESMLDLVHDGMDPAFAESGDRARGRSELGLNEHGELLLCVAKLTDHKGHRYLIDAMPEILKARGKVLLALAGDGELRQELERHVAELGLQNRVRFLGYRADVPDLLAAADVVIQPSHMEGLCSSLIDAMFAKKAIVATRAGGIPDLFEQTSSQRFAFLVPTKCPQSLAKATLDVLAQPAELARKIGDAANARARQRFTHDVMVEKTLDSIERIRARMERERITQAA